MPKPGYTQSEAHKRKRSQALEGEDNPAYKDGRRSYRRIAGAKPNDGTVVHHVSGDRSANDPENLERLTDGKRKKGRKTTPKHEKITRRAAKEEGEVRADRSAAYYEGVAIAKAKLSKLKQTR